VFFKKQVYPFDLEKTVLLELHIEHEYVRRIHKVKLSPISIALFDSSNRWGEFNSLTRTIHISRKLIHEHPWHHVLGVFRHEMAHQYVHEHHRHIHHREKPHGELFASACKILGVPAQFAKAGLDLQNCDLDWRNEPRDEATEKIIDKTKKLLSLANSTNEHEAHLAMDRVRELYCKYNLEQMAKNGNESFYHLITTRGKKRIESWEQRAISILTEHFFVKVITLQQFDAQKGHRVQAIEIIGRKENVLMAEYVYSFLLLQVEHYLSQTTHNGDRMGRSERASFRLGILDGFDLKLSQVASVNKMASEKNLISLSLSKFRNDHAFAAGHRVGQTISINKPINQKEDGRGRLLTSTSKQ
jgi:Protein of unknown function (DUF2786)